MKLKDIIQKLVNTKDYENLREILGEELGDLIYQLVDESERADKELNIVHSCITDLYNIDANTDRIKEALREVEKI